LWHALIVAVLIQFGRFLWTMPRVEAMPNFELTWSGPIEDLPLLTPKGPAKQPSPPGDPQKPVPLRGADAFHPRQTIISAPKLPTHPRQTLIQPDMPPEAPKILPPLPNMVFWKQAEPARPKMQISAEEFAKMHPNQPIPQQNRDVAVPELPNQERNPADINIAEIPDPARPALRIKSGASTITAPKPAPTVASQTDPPPDIAPTGGNQRVIAISAMPAPVPPPAQMPQGNLSSRVTISPEGIQPGVPGGSPNGAAGNGGTAGNSTSPGGAGNNTGGNGSAPGVSITGGNPRNSSGTSGLGGSPYSGSNLPSLHVTPGMTARPAPANSDAPAVKPADASVSGRIQAGDPPERIFGERTFYTLHVNSPNISSKMGSWVLKFAELNDDGSPAAIARRATGTLSGPVALHKADPRYPPALMQAHVQGEVVLYAIIRENGSVDSIQVIRPLDPVLDRNSMEAFATWKFQPGTRNGVPVALEAVIHIPFRTTRPD
jgi:TonB family protein